MRRFILIFLVLPFICVSLIAFASSQSGETESLLKGFKAKIICYNPITKTTETLTAYQDYFPKSLSVSPQKDKLAFWQIDSRWILNQYDEKKLKELGVRYPQLCVLDLRTREKKIVVPSSVVTRLGVPDKPSWSPDGKRLAFAYVLKLNGVQRATIYTVNSDGSDLKAEFLDNEFGIIDSPVWIDDQKFAYKTHERGLKGNIIYEFDTKSKTRRLLYRGPVVQYMKLSADKKTLILSIPIVKERKPDIIRKEIYLNQREPLDLTVLAEPGVKIQKPSDKAWRVEKVSTVVKTSVPTIFKLTDDGKTVTDTTTNLVWIRNPSDAGVDSAYQWKEAVEVCLTLKYAGYSDWRLPTLEELKTIINIDRSEPAINTEFFFCKSGKYWTATTFESDSHSAWYISFKDGFVGIDDKLNAAFIRPVRSAE